MSRPTTGVCDEHDPCEGESLHIKGRCATGCPQFQDGSWMARGFCWEAHPSKVEYGEADATRDWLEAEFAANRRP